MPAKCHHCLSFKYQIFCLFCCHLMHIRNIRSFGRWSFNLDMWRLVTSHQPKPASLFHSNMDRIVCFWIESNFDYFQTLILTIICHTPISVQFSERRTTQTMPLKSNKIYEYVTSSIWVVSRASCVCVFVLPVCHFVSTPRLS